MAIRSILAGAARTSTRAGVRAALLPKAPPSQICGAHLMPATPSKAPASPCIGLATKIYGAKLMPAMPSKAQAVAASLRSGVAPQVGGADLMPAMPSKAPVVGAGGSGLVAVARLPGNTAATTQAIAGRFNPAHSGVTGATMISLTPGTTVVLSWIAGSRAKPVLAVIPSAARASYYTTSKAAAGGTPGTSWASRSFAARALSTSTKAPAAAGKPGRGPWSYLLALCAIGGGVTALWFSVPEIRKENKADEQHQVLPNYNKQVISAEDLRVEDLPEYIDWEEKGVIIEPHWYNEIDGYCWAVSAIASIEAALVIETGRVVELSIQQLIDWSKNAVLPRNMWGKGIVFLHLVYAELAKSGLRSEEAYPSTSIHGDRCLELDGKPIVARIDGCTYIRNTERDFMLALQKQPIAVYVNSSVGLARLFGHPDDILDIQQCPPGKDIPLGDHYVISSFDHVVLLVGYGTDKESGKKYWKIRNTWGDTWGRRGYGRLERGGTDWRGVAGITAHRGYAPVISKHK